jgi:cytidylate kinase
MQLDEGDIASRRVLEWSLRQKALREAGTTPAPRPAVITLSDQLGAHGKEITEALQAQLGDAWRVWDRNLLDEIARRADTRLQLLEAIDERAQSQIDLTIRSLLNIPVVEEATYLHQLAHVILSVAHQGNAIIVGRGGNLIVRDALRVRLRAPFRHRVETIAAALGISREEAERRVRESDRQRADFIRVEFAHDIDNPEEYDLFLRTDTLGVAGAAGAIVGAARAIFEAPALARRRSAG